MPSRGEKRSGFKGEKRKENKVFATAGWACRYGLLIQYQSRGSFFDFNWCIIYLNGL